MPFQTQALNELAATITGAASAAAEANALAQNAQQKNELIIAGDAVEVNTDYTMDGTKAVVIADTATAAADITITLPDAALNDGKLYWIKRTGGTHTLVVVPQGSQTIDGLAQVPGGFAQNASILVVAIGDNWTLLSQSIGTPPLLDIQVLTSDAALDPDVPMAVLQAGSNPVTLTLPPVASVEGRQYLIVALDVSNPATVRVDPLTTDGFPFGPQLPGGGTAFTLPVTGYTVLLIGRIFFGQGFWLATSVGDPRLTNITSTRDTSGRDQSDALPPAVSGFGPLRCYKNTGSGGHTYTISPDGMDTIDGSASAIVLTDGGSITLVRDSVTASNWVSIVGSNVTIPTSVEAFAEDTTSADVPVTLPLALSSGGLLILYKNTGTGGHDVLVSRTGADTIDGAGTGPALVDGQWAGFVREDGSTTNWVSIVKPLPPVIPPAAVVSVVDTTAGDVPVTLPASSASVGTVVGYKNSGSTGHLVTVSPAGGDSIDGGAGPIAVANSKWACFVLQDGNATNWVSLAEAAPIAQAIDTTTGDQTGALPFAMSSPGAYYFKNAGTGGHTLSVGPNAGDTIDGLGASVPVADGHTVGFVVETGDNTNWVSLVAGAPIARPIATGSDTSVSLPPAIHSLGAYCFKNTGTGGHTLTVNPAGTDTIDGAGTGVAVVDGKTACFVVELGSTTNWVLVSLA